MRYGSLFSGAGGFDMGLDEAGLSCAWQVEIDRTARSVLARHWPDVPKFNDVRECGKHNLPRVDAIVGGFPCQDLSVAGKRAGLMGGERSGLWWEMLRVVREIQPGVVVFENVPGLRSKTDEVEADGLCLCGWDSRWGGMPGHRSGSAKASVCGSGLRRDDGEGTDDSSRTSTVVRRITEEDAGSNGQVGRGVDVDDCREADDSAVGGDQAPPAAQGQASPPLAGVGGDETGRAECLDGGNAEPGGGDSGVSDGLESQRPPGGYFTAGPTPRPGGICPVCGRPIAESEDAGPIRRFDLATVVGSLRQHGYFGCVRTLDARHFGVPQSRPRLFGVFARGPDGAERACQILAVRDSLPWHSQAGRQAGQEVAGAITARFGRNGGAANGDVDGNRLVVGPLQGHTEGAGCRIGADEAAAGLLHVAPAVTPGARRASGQRAGELLHVYGGNDTRGERRGDTALSAKAGSRQDFETENFVLQCHGANVGPFGTLRAGNGNASGGVPFVFESKKAGEGRADGVAPALRAMGHADSHANAGGQLAVLATEPLYYSHDYNQDRIYGTDGITPALTAADSNRTRNHFVAGLIRRFTPRECERLMGWPDDWTRWRADGSEIKDGPRYKMCGNGVAKPVAWWLGMRLKEFA